jgi:hypothetical protein
VTAVVDIVNQAASQIGARAQCTSVNPSDGTPLGDAASLLYTGRIQALLRAAHWNCCRWQAPLTLLKAAAGTPPNVNGTTLPIPPLGFLYEYAYPADCLAGRFVIPTPLPQPAVSPPLTTGPIQVLPFARLSVSVPFVTALDFNTQVPPARVKVILTNAYTAQLVYTADISNEPDLWDPSLTDAAVAYLAAWLVNPLNMKSSLLQERGAMVKELVMAARVSDGNEGVTPNDHVPDWIQSRLRSGGFNFSSYENGANYMGSWSVLGLPGGISF